MDFSTSYVISYWGDVGGYINGEGQHNTTPTNDYASNSVMPIEPAYIGPGPPPYDVRPFVQQTVPMVTSVSASTASTTTAGSPLRRTLTGDERRQICVYHESHPGVKQTEIGAMFGVERSTISKVLRQKEKFLNSNDGAVVKSEGQDESTSRMPHRSAATPVSDSATEESLTAIDPRPMTKRNESVPGVHPARSTSMQPPPIPPLPRSENTSPVSSGSPTQDDARRALDLVKRYLWSQPAGFVQPDEYALVGSLTVKLSINKSKRRKFKAVTIPCH